MRKRIATILALVVVASMVLVGCGKGNDQDSLVGLWSGTIDVTDTVNEEVMASLGADAEALEGFKDLTMKVTLELREDQTYTLAFDKESMDAFMEQIKVQMKGVVLSYMESMLKDMGLDMDPEEAMDAAGISIDDMIEEAFGAGGMDFEGMDLNVSGNYLVKDGNIHLADVDDKAEDVVPNPYTLDGDKLTIEADEISATQYFAEYMFPLVLERVK